MAALALCDGPHSVCGVCFSLNLNQSISFLFMFYWRIIALQNFVVFCHTSTWISHQFSSVTQSGLTLCDPIDCSTPGFPVHHLLPELEYSFIVFPALLSQVQWVSTCFCSLSSHKWKLLFLWEMRRYVWADLGSGCCSTILASMQETLSQESPWSSLGGPDGDPEGKACKRVRTF